MSRVEAELAQDLQDAETKAWDSLAKYKFMMFGYWAAIWVHQNRVGGFKRRNPWSVLVGIARERRGVVAEPMHAPLFEDEAA